MRHSVKIEDIQTDYRSKNGGRSRCTLSTIMLLVWAMVASGHSGVQTYGRQPENEVIHKMRLGPPGLMNPYMPSYESNTYKDGVRNELTNHTYAHQIKEDKTLNGLRIATINVTSWSPKILRMIAYMSGEFDILLIQEHHKLRRKDR